MKIQEVMNKYPVTVGKDAPISDMVGCQEKTADQGCGVCTA